MVFLLSGCLAINASAQQQNDTLQLLPVLNNLKVLGDSMIRSSSDSIRLKSHATFAVLFDSIIHLPNAEQLSFYQVPALSVQESPDHVFRIFNWMLINQQQNSNAFFGYIEIFSSEKQARRIIPLVEKKYVDNPSAEILRLDSSNWYGCVYYKIIHERVRKKDYYMLLGWAPQSTMTTRKIIEPFQISPSKINFGAPVIKTGGRPKLRMIFEYNSQTSMTLRYEEEKHRIVFDNLSSSDPRRESKGIYMLYGPDFSYNELKFESGYWIMTKDIDIRNKKEQKNQSKEPVPMRLKGDPANK